jgi:hypothetical protein
LVPFGRIGVKLISGFSLGDSLEGFEDQGIFVFNSPLELIAAADVESFSSGDR